MIINQETIMNILTSTYTQYTIFPYQRLYQWPEKLVAIMYEDVKAWSEDELLEHFLGTVHLKDHGYTAGNHIKTIEVIDCQQRLITLFIMIKALSEYAASVNDYAIAKVANEMLFNCVNRNDLDENHTKIRLKRYDFLTFKEIMFDRRVKNKNSLIYRNYIYLLNRFKKDKVNPDAFLKALNRIYVVKCITERSEDSLTVFHRVNSDRQELHKYDFIRARILNGLTEKQQEQLDNEYISKLENIFSNNMDEILEFLRDYLIINQKIAVNKNNIIQVFDEYFLSENYNVVKCELEKMIDCANIYSSIINGQHDDPEVERKLEDFKRMNIRPTRFLILKFIYDFDIEKITKQELIDILMYLESYLIRRYMADLKTNQLNGVFVGLINQIKENDYSNSIKYYLIKCNFVNNDCFKKGFLETPIYGKSPSISKYILSKIEHHIQPKEVVDISEKITVEHIMPQDIRSSEEWKKSLGENFEYVHKEFVHRIGNLTLTGNNSKLSNYSFTTKINIKNGFKESNIKLSRDLSDLKDWNENEINNRALRLFQIATEIWRYPQISVSDEYSENILTIYDNWSSANLIKIKVFDKEFEVSSNKTQVYKIIIQELYNKNKNKFIELIESKVITAKDFAATKGEDLYNQYFVLDAEKSILIGTKLNAQRKNSFIKRVVELLEYDVNDIKFIELKQPFKQMAFA